MDKKEYMKEYWKNNKEKIALHRNIPRKKYLQRPDIKLKRKEYMKEYMKEYKQRVQSIENKKIQDKKYASSHRDKLNKYNLSYYHKNKEKILPKIKVYNNIYYKKNKEKILLQKKIHNNTLERKNYRKKYRENNKEQHRKQVKKYRELHYEKCKLREKEYYKNNKKKFIERLYQHRRKNPEVLIAYIKSQKIPHKEKCEWCGSDYILQKHHPNYLKPLEVITLCINCHCKTKKNYGGVKGVPLLN